MSGSSETGLREVGYFLSRLGIDKPPIQLNANTWKEAYLMFYGSFELGKTEQEFRNSLKNLRDHFDCYMSNTRVGWGDQGSPQKLCQQNQEVYDKLQKLDDKQLWSQIRGYATTTYSIKNEKRVKNIQENQAKYFSSEFGGERQINQISTEQRKEIEVNHGRIVDSLKDFIEQNENPVFVFNTQKIDLACEFDGVLKKIYEVKTSTDTQSIYTAVGQLYMHTTEAKNISKWIVLPGPIDNQRLIDCLTSLEINILWFKVNENHYEFIPNATVFT